MNHRVLEHTADLYIEGYGKTFEEAIEGVAEGMFKHMGKAKKEKESFEIEFSSSEVGELIVGLFSKILSECESEGFIPKKMKVLEYDKLKGKLKVKVFGEKGLLSNIIKAVTYHLFEIEERKGEVKIRVLYDT